VTWPRVQNVLYHAPAHVAGAGRLVLVAIADKTPGMDPRIPCVVDMARRDIALAANTPEKNVRQTLDAMLKNGLDVRVPVGKDKHGRPVYAFRGSVPRWCLPYFPPVVDDCPCMACWEARTQEGAYSKAPSIQEGACPQSEGASQKAEGAYVQAEGASQQAPLLIPINRPTDSVVGQQEEERLRQAKTITDKVRDLTVVDRRRLTTLVSDQLAVGWGLDAVRAELDKPLSGASSIYAVLHALIRSMGQPPAPKPKPAEIPWCGQCDAANNRWIEKPDAEGNNRWARCPTCNPHAKSA
jgi:hypothetical protein